MFVCTPWQLIYFAQFLPFGYYVRFIYSYAAQLGIACRHQHPPVRLFLIQQAFWGRKHQGVSTIQDIWKQMHRNSSYALSWPDLHYVGICEATLIHDTHSEITIPSFSVALVFLFRTATDIPCDENAAI